MSTKSGPNYQNLEKLLFRGFLTISADLGGIPVVFKTINMSESDLIDLYVPFGLKGAKKTQYRESYSLAYSVFLFNGVNVLKNRDYYVPQLVETFLTIPQKVRDQISIRLKLINEQSLNEFRKIEAYSYGIFSKQKWYSCKGTPLNDPILTGIPGTNHLGLNSHQKRWIFLNRTEDKKEEGETLWELTKFQASVHNPKGVKNLYAKDKAKKREEFRRRKMLFETEGRSGSGDDINSEGEIRISHESVEDLNRQLKNAMEGEKDFHDKVIESHEKRVREQFEEEKKARMAKKQGVSKHYKDQFEGTEATNDPFIFFDEGEVREQVVEQRKRKKEKLEQGYYQGNRAFLDREERLSKWGITEGGQGPKHVDPKVVDRMAEEDQKKEKSSVEGTLLDDYYNTSQEDLDPNPADFDPKESK